MAGQTPKNPFDSIVDGIAGLFRENTKGSSYGGLPIGQNGAPQIVPKLPTVKIGGSDVPLRKHFNDLHDTVTKAGESVSEANKNALRKAGQAADYQLHQMQEKVAAAKEALTEEHGRLLNTRGGPKKEALVKQYDESLKKLGKYEDVLVEQRTELQKKGGHELIGGKAEYSAPAEAGAAVGGAVAKGTQIFLSNKAEAAKLGVIGEKAYNELSGTGKFMARVKAGFKVSKIEKTGEVVATKLPGMAMKGGAVALGTIIGGYGLKDLGQAVGMVGPDTDEQGKELPTDGKLFKAAAEIGASALAIAALLKGSGNKAMGVMGR